jgi:nitrite reductase/ring-hydroxylating ferredoxin subunit
MGPPKKQPAETRRVPLAGCGWKPVKRPVSLPLDYGDGEVFDEAGKMFQCRTHGALYRIEDGRCVVGPCSGASLKPVEIVEKEEGGYLPEER